MRNPVNFPPLTDAQNAEIAGKIRDGKLDYPDLFPLIAHLAYERPRTVLLTPARHDAPLEGQKADNSHDHEMLFHFASGCLHDDLMRGNLPTAPVNKYPLRHPAPLLDTDSGHEAALRKAAIMAELFLAHEVTVYADFGVDEEMREMISLAKALELPIRYRLLHTPELWAGKPGVKNLEAALAAHEDIPAWPGFRTVLEPARKKDIEKRLAEKSLGAGDVLDAALYIHDRPHIVVESPYAPKFGKDTPKAFGVMDLSINIRMAYAAQRSLLLEGYLPSASHTEFTQPGVLDDTNTHERVLGIAAGLAKTLFFDETRLYDNRDISSGMEKGVEFAVKIDRPVYRYRVFDLPAEYWRGSFEDYLEEVFKPKSDAMEMAMELTCPDTSDPELAILAATYMPWDALKKVTSYMGEETMTELVAILPEELMRRVHDARAEFEREESQKVICEPKRPFALEKLRQAAPCPAGQKI